MSSLDFPTYQIFVSYQHAPRLIRTLQNLHRPTSYWEIVYLPHGIFFGFPNPLEQDTARIKLFLDVLELPHRVLAER
jgi:hypothetical protein